MTLRICKKCNVTKDLTDFPIVPKCKGGRRPVCKICANKPPENYEYVENKFDKLGRLLESEIYDDAGRRKQFSKYRYNKYGKKLEKFSKVGIGKESKSTYQYDQTNELVSSYYYYNSRPVLYYEYSHEYW